MESENEKLQNEVSRLKALLATVQSKGEVPTAQQTFKAAPEANSVASARERMLQKRK
jgi:hypothetical protein